MTRETPVGVIGGGSWGTTAFVCCGRQPGRLCVRRQDHADEINQSTMSGTSATASTRPSRESRILNRSRRNAVDCDGGSFLLVS